MMFKYFRLSSVSFLLFAFICFSCFALDTTTLDFDSIADNAVLTNWDYVYLWNNSMTFPSYQQGNTVLYSRGPGLYSSKIVPDKQIYISPHYVQFDSVLNYPNRNTGLSVFIPILLKNVSYLDFDFYLFIGTYKGTTGTMQGNITFSTSDPDDYAPAWSQVFKFGSNYGYETGVQCSVLGIEQFSIGEYNPAFIHYHFTADLSYSDYECRGIGISLYPPFDTRVFQKLNITYGIEPDTAVISLADPQLIQLNNNIDRQTDRILYEVSPGNQDIINASNSRLSSVKSQTQGIVDTLSQTDDLTSSAKVEELQELTSFDSIKPEGYEEVQGDFTHIMQDSFDNTPLALMLIISLSIVTVSYILFGKKGVG